MIAPRLKRLPNESRPRPERWRNFGVTVCIAMMADNERQLVLVADQKVGFGDFSADGLATKNTPFIAHWTVMVSGDDIGPAGPIIARARRRCQQGRIVSADEIADVIHDEIKKEREKLVESQVLAKYGFTMDVFKKQGKRICTETVYFDICSKMERVTMPIEFLLSGFDEDGRAHIRWTDSSTPPRDYDSVGFCAIGSGANAALGSLCHSCDHLSLSKYRNVEEVAYHVIAAKFMAESAINVGNKTFVAVVGKEGDAKHISPLLGMDTIREQWKKHGAPMECPIFCAIGRVSVAHRFLRSDRCRIWPQGEPGAKRLAPLAAKQWMPAKPQVLVIGIPARSAA